MFLQKIKDTQTLDFYTIDMPENADAVQVPLYMSKVSAGFPSPADDYIETALDFNKFLIKHPAATFCVKVKGSSMINAGMNDGDVLVVDRSIEPKTNSIVVAILNGEFTVKRLSKNGKNLYLLPENDTYKPILITETMDFEVWGVVTFIVKNV